MTGVAVQGSTVRAPLDRSMNLPTYANAGRGVRAYLRPMRARCLVAGRGEEDYRRRRGTWTVAPPASAS